MRVAKISFFSLGVFLFSLVPGYAFRDHNYPVTVMAEIMLWTLIIALVDVSKP